MLRRIFLVPALLAALALSGCSGGTSIFTGGGSLLGTITNPLGINELAAVEGAYGVALTGAVSYRRYCYSAPLAQLPKEVCGNRRAVVRKLQELDNKAYAAIVAARNFARDNPTISAFSVIGAARQAVADFQSLASAYRVN